MKAKPSQIPKCYILPTTRENSPFGLRCFCFPSAPSNPANTPSAPPPACIFSCHWHCCCCCCWLPAGLRRLSSELAKREGKSWDPSPAAAWAAFDDDGISFGSCVRHRLMAAIHQITRWRWRTASRKFGRRSCCPREFRFAAGRRISFLFLHSFFCLFWPCK